MLPPELLGPDTAAFTSNRASVASVSVGAPVTFAEVSATAPVNAANVTYAAVTGAVAETSANVTGAPTDTLATDARLDVKAAVSGPSSSGGNITWTITANNGSGYTAQGLASAKTVLGASN